MRISDWSSDVCSSDLHAFARKAPGHQPFRLFAARLCAGQARHDHDQAAPIAFRRAEKAIASFRCMPRFEPVRAGEMAQDRIAVRLDDRQIGRASCRGRVWQYVYISVVAVSLKNKIDNEDYTRKHQTYI